MIQKNKKTMKKFAIYFDKIYSDKNYTSECNFIIKNIIKNKINGKKILDFGCGTGNHAIILSKHGFDVTGVDISRTVINIARKKSSGNNKVKFVYGNMMSVNLYEKFDICISLFSSLCYLTEISELRKALLNVYKHLKRNGILIFDFWNGNAVITTKPSVKIKFFEKNHEKIKRIAIPELNIEKQTCSIKYHCIVKNRTKIIDEFSETHIMRYHFMNDLKELLNNVGFRKISMMPMKSNNNLSNNKKFLKNWYLFCVAQKFH